MHTPASPLLARLRRDASGNTLAIVAAGMAPLLAIIGSGIDLGRGYMSETRLQQACDSGVLAARKKLGATVAPAGTPPAGVVAAGNRFFNLNFKNGAYGTEDRSFTMTLAADLTVKGVATVEVPTTVMNLFGFQKVDVAVECSAKLNYTNTDVMMVLDTTGSMNQTNPGDSMSKIAALKSVVTNFHAQMEAGKGPSTRIRYGFVPYSTNVNVGHLLLDNWVVGNWTYQSRELHHTETTTDTRTYNANWTQMTDGAVRVTVSSYAATYHPAVAGSGGGPSNELGGSSGGGGSPAYYSCDGAQPANTYTENSVLLSENTTAYAGPPAGDKITKHYRTTYNGNYYWTSLSGSTCTVYADQYNNDVWEWDRITVPDEDSVDFYRYAPIARNVSNWRSETHGCMEERATYEITDYDNVDLTRALDLDLDKVPTNDNERWRPMYPNIIRERSRDWYGGGSFTLAEVITSNKWFFQPVNIPSLVACPAPARKLNEMDPSQLAAYLASITAAGTTYHDIGMIWGGRLISKSGLFAAENADLTGRPTSRHLIFLTDGQTESYDIAYGAYGVEPLDRRRWSSSSPLTLNETVEERFGVACQEVKKRNVTVWVIGFGTSVSQMMKDCAGNGKWFKADDASQLTAAFDKITASMGDLRISK